MVKNSTHFMKQQGGVFLGVVIGVLVGLAAALAVAVYVAKVPVPFVNKGQNRNAGQDEAEARKNKDWNPNAPLAGKNSARPASAAGAVTPPSSPAPAPAPTAATTIEPSEAAKAAASAAKAAARAEIKAAAALVVKAAGASEAKPLPVKPASADPLGDLAKAKSAIAAGPAGADPFLYFVQAGAFRTPEDAEAQRAKLSLTGLEAKITEREQSGRTVYRVRLGPFDKKDEADRQKEKLEAGGQEAALVRVQR